VEEEAAGSTGEAAEAEEDGEAVESVVSTNLKIYQDSE
jgi:hypothetical protein